MDVEEAERAELERRISEAGWHIVRDTQVGDGYAVEFQRAPYTDFVPGAETRTYEGRDRNDAYRHFLEDLKAEHPSRQA